MEKQSAESSVGNVTYSVTQFLQQLSLKKGERKGPLEVEGRDTSSVCGSCFDPDSSKL